MDPRHPELALPRVKELIEQLEESFDEIKNSTVRNSISQLERKGALIIQEICLTAPRLHETLISVSRNRRGELSRDFYNSIESNTTISEVVEKKPRSRKAKKGKK